MKQFIFSFLGTLAALFLCVIILIAGLGITSESAVLMKNESVLTVNLSGTINDYNPGSELEELLGKSPEITLHQLRNYLAIAENDLNIKSLYLNIDNIETSLANIEELIDIIQRFKANSGKSVYVYLSNPNFKDYLLASSADYIGIHPESMTLFSSPKIQIDFYKDLLKEIGVEADFVSVGKYKSAPETYTRTEMSEASKIQYQELLDAMFKIQKNILYTSRKEIDLIALKKALNQSLLSANDLLELQFVDSILYADQFLDYIYNQSSALSQMDFNDYSLVATSTTKDFDQSIAIIYAQGMIASGNVESDPIMGDILSDERLIASIEEAARNKRIKAILIRIDSPGGSAFASDNIYHAIQLARNEKPVYLSMGSTAASGAYYIAAACDTVFSYASTITGSIGVFAGKFDISGLKKNLLKINRNEIKIQDLDDIDFFDSERRFTNQEKKIFQKQLDAFYERFLLKVAEGQNLTMQSTESIAQGRVWLGEQARQIGLVDSLTGIHGSIEYIKKKLSLPENAALRVYPRKKSLFEDPRLSLFFSQSDFQNLRESILRLEEMGQNSLFSILPYQVRFK